MLAENRKAERAEKLKRRSESSKTPNRFILPRQEVSGTSVPPIPSVSRALVSTAGTTSHAPANTAVNHARMVQQESSSPRLPPDQLEILANLTRNPSSFRDVTIVRIHGLVRNNFNASLQNFHRIDATPEGQVSSRAGRSHQRRHSQHYTSMGPNSHNAPPSETHFWSADSTSNVHGSHPHSVSVIAVIPHSRTKKNSRRAAGTD